MRREIKLYDTDPEGQFEKEILVIEMIGSKLIFEGYDAQNELLLHHLAHRLLLPSALVVALDELFTLDKPSSPQVWLEKTLDDFEENFYSQPAFTLCSDIGLAVHYYQGYSSQYWDLAYNSETPSHILDHLAQEGDSLLNLQISQNPSTSVSTLLKLWKISDQTARRHLYNHHAFPKNNFDIDASMYPPVRLIRSSW